jgi:hypothetical protein
MAAGSAKLRVFGARWRRRSGELADRLNNMPSTSCRRPSNIPTGTTRGPKGRCCDRGLEAQAGNRRRNRGPCELSAGAHPDRTRLIDELQVVVFPGRTRDWGPLLWRDQRQEAHAARQHPENRQRPCLPHLRVSRLRRTLSRAAASVGERLFGVPPEAGRYPSTPAGSHHATTTRHRLAEAPLVGQW